MNAETDESKAADETADVNESPVGARRKVLTQVIPTSRLTLPKQVEIIRAYGAAYDATKAPVGIEEITGYVKMAAATVSQTNAFLTDVGVVRKDGRRFVPSSEVITMNRLYEVSKEKALAKLAPLFENSWFGQMVMPKLKFRPMPEDDIVHDLFEAATAEPQHLGQVRTLIDYLVLVGLVERDAGKLKVKNGPVDEPTQDIPAAVVPTPLGNSLGGNTEMPEAVLLLTPDGSRRVTVKAPPTITTAELARIRNWLEYQLIVKDEGSPTTGAKIISP